MTRLVLLTDRPPEDVLPALDALEDDVKTEPLARHSLAHLTHLSASVVLVDAVEDPGLAYSVLEGLGAVTGASPVVVAAHQDLEVFPWHEVAAGLVFPDSPPGELRVRISMLLRGPAGGRADVLRLGPLSIDVQTFRVSLPGRVLDLAFKEFELLRFLVQHPGRVFDRSTLLRRVWGYNFYGGTRTVDVHVRRLRAKLGPEHEWLIETVRGVGYRAALSRPPNADLSVEQE